MFHFLTPKRVWQRLLLWQLVGSLLYGLILFCVCRMVDAFESPPEHEGLRIWFPTGLFIFVWGILIYPVLLLFAWVGALLCPQRHGLRAGDYVGLVVSFLFITITAFVIGGFIMCN